jgi:ABC-type branched-subunit amino acid transport system substrate-binding protein
MLVQARSPGSLVRPGEADTLNVAIVVPLQGPAGIFGPSCVCCAQLAAEEVNAESGVLGRPAVGRAPAAVAVLRGC